MRPATAATASITHGTPLGTLRLTATDAGLRTCAFVVVDDVGDDGDDPDAPRHPHATGTGDARRWLALAVRELDAYLAGARRTFTVPIDVSASPGFDRRVWSLLSEVGVGETTTYGALAHRAGLGAGEARRVGGALARNPVLIVVPCHRVLGADGSLTGYAGGLERKRALLDHEAADVAGTQLVLM